jgi:hypothetical protein
MSSRIGISAEPQRATSTRRIAATLALTALLAAIIGAARFRTVASDGTERVRSAPFVWTVAAEHIRRDAPTPAMYAVYAASLAATTAGCFLLLWLAAAVGRDNDTAQGGSAAVAAFRDVAAVFARRPAISPRAARTCVVAMLALAALTVWRMGLFARLRAGGVAAGRHSAP